MADGIPFAGSTVATDEVTVSSETMHVQRNKLIHGVNGSNDGDVAHSNPLPVSAQLAADFMTASGTALTPKFAVINLTATGTLVAAVTGKKIRVLALFMTIEVVTGDETYTFKDGAAGTAITGALGDTAMTVLATTPPIPCSMPFCPVGLFETTAGTLLELSLAGTTPNAQGSLVYVEV